MQAVLNLNFKCSKILEQTESLCLLNNVYGIEKNAIKSLSYLGGISGPLYISWFSINCLGRKSVSYRAI
jgi:hypothetical protein